MRPTRAGLFAAALCLATAIPAMTGWAAPVPRLRLAGTLRTTDPALVMSVADERFALACYEGLTVLDPVTGELKAGAAEKWEVSPDGKTWTFTLRDAKWMRKFGDAIQSKGAVKASDFVFAWMRLFDPDTASPHINILDVLPGVSALSTDKTRAASLDRVISALDAAIGGKARKSLTAEKVHEFLNDVDIGARRWLADLGTPESREILAWPTANSPYQGSKAAKLMELLAKERERSLAVAIEAEAHVGVDRGFFAKDDKTLVVQTRGAAPWLLSLLARAPLLPLHQRTVESLRDQAFGKRQNFVGNGAYVSDTEVPIETDNSGDPTAFKAILLKNPEFHDAAHVVTERIDISVNEVEDEIFRLFAKKDLAWIYGHALKPDTARGIRAAKSADWKPKKDADKCWKDLSPNAYDVGSGSVFVLRFKCGAPLDKKETRRALASLIDRKVLAAKAPSTVLPPVVTRFVHPNTTGASTSVRVPTFDAAGASAAYGARKYTSDISWMTLLCSSDDDLVADGVVKAFKAGKIPDDANTTVKVGTDFRRALDQGEWDLVLQDWRPAFDDPLAFLAPFVTRSPAGDSLWSNPVYDALIAGALDVTAFAASPPAVVKDVAGVTAALAGAKDPKGLEDLRRVLLAEAESILLEEAVVVPLWIPVESGVALPTLKGLSLGGAKPRNLLDVIPIPPIVLED